MRASCHHGTVSTFSEQRRELGRKVLITPEKVIIKSCQNCSRASAVQREAAMEGQFTWAAVRLNTLPCSQSWWRAMLLLRLMKLMEKWGRSIRDDYSWGGRRGSGVTTAVYRRASEHMKRKGSMFRGCTRVESGQWQEETEIWMNYSFCGTQTRANPDWKIARSKRCQAIKALWLTKPW